MTKNDYLNLRLNNNIMPIIYKYYCEKFDSKKHTPLLTEQELFPYIQIYLDINKVATKVFNYYDGLYSVVTIYDKNGNLISYS